jgi:hypothetical protein
LDEKWDIRHTYPDNQVLNFRPNSSTLFKFNLKIGASMPDLNLFPMVNPEKEKANNQNLPNVYSWLLTKSDQNILFIPFVDLLINLEEFNSKWFKFTFLERVELR